MKMKTIMQILTIITMIFAIINLSSAIFLTGDEKFQSIVIGMLQLIIAMLLSKWDDKINLTINNRES